MSLPPRPFYKAIRRAVRLVVVLGCSFLYLVVSSMVFLVLLFTSSCRKRRVQSKLIQWFTRSLIRILNVRIHVRGLTSFASTPGRAAFLVSNHLGYLDGLVLGSLLPLTYVSKIELKKWPLIGLMIQVSGTLLIDRKRKNHIAAYVDLIAGVLKGGTNVLFFPEGSSTSGETLLPFKSAFFEVPLQAGACVVPISLIYRAVEGVPLNAANRDRVCWYGEMTFADHFFRLLGCESIDVEVRFHEPIVPEDLDGALERSGLRKQLCERATSVILSSIQPHFIG